MKLSTKVFVLTNARRSTSDIEPAETTKKITEGVGFMIKSKQYNIKI